MKVERKKSVIKFSKDLLFRKAENLLAWGASNWWQQEATNQEKGKCNQWELTQGLEFSFTGVQFTVLSFRVSFGHVLWKHFETSLRWPLTSFHFHGSLQHSHRNLFKTSSKQLLSFISLVGLSRMWANNTEERHFTPSSS